MATFPSKFGGRQMTIADCDHSHIYLVNNCSENLQILRLAVWFTFCLEYLLGARYQNQNTHISSIIWSTLTISAKEASQHAGKFLSMSAVLLVVFARFLHAFQIVSSLVLRTKFNFSKSIKLTRWWHTLVLTWPNLFWRILLQLLLKFLQQ